MSYMDGEFSRRVVRRVDPGSEESKPIKHESDHSSHHSRHSKKHRQDRSHRHSRSPSSSTSHHHSSRRSRSRSKHRGLSPKVHDRNLSHRTEVRRTHVERHKTSSCHTPQEGTEWSPLVRDVYNPIKVGSIDGTDVEPHDRAITRAMNSRYAPNKGVTGDPTCTVIVARLCANTEPGTVEKVMGQMGPLRRPIRLVRDVVTGCSRRYAFVEYEKPEDARYAASKCGSVFIDGAQVIVEMELERSLPGWKPRRLGGGLGGFKESGQLRFGGRGRKFRMPFTCFETP